MRYAIRFTLLFVIAFLAGCYETTFSLGDGMKVDDTLIGTWDFDAIGGNSDEKAVLTVAKADDTHYAVQWKTLGDGKVSKLIGTIVELNGAHFAQVAAVDADGKPAAKHQIIRIDRDGDDGLTMSALDSAYFENKKIDSDATLHDVVAAGVTDPSLYDINVMIGKRAKP